MKRKKSLKELCEIYPEWVACIKYMEGVATKDIRRVESGDEANA